MERDVRDAGERRPKKELGKWQKVVIGGITVMILGGILLAVAGVVGGGGYRDDYQSIEDLGGDGSSSSGWFGGWSIGDSYNDDGDVVPRDHGSSAGDVQLSTTGRMGLMSEDVTSARGGIDDIVVKAGGELTSLSDSDTRGYRLLYVDYDVPSDKFAAVVADIEGIDGVYVDWRDIDADNVGDDMENLAKANEELKVELAEIESWLEGHSEDDPVYKEKADRADYLRTTIRLNDRDVEDIGEMVEMSPLSITLAEVDFDAIRDELPFGERLVRTFENSVGAASSFVENVVLFVVGNWWLVAIVGVGVVLIRRRVKHVAAMREEAERGVSGGLSDGSDEE